MPHVRLWLDNYSLIQWMAKRAEKNEEEKVPTNNATCKTMIRDLVNAGLEFLLFSKGIKQLTAKKNFIVYNYINSINLY